MTAGYEHYLYKGKELFEAGEIENAIKIFSKAVLINPKADKAYNNRGCCYLKLEQYRKAIDDFTEAVKLNPESGNPYAHRALCYQKLGQYEDAIIDYTEAIYLDSFSASSLLYKSRGDCYKLSGEYHFAKEDYNSALLLANPSEKEKIKKLILEIESNDDLLPELQTTYERETTKINELLKELTQHEDPSRQMKKFISHAKKQYSLKKDIEKEQKRIAAEKETKQKAEKLYTEAQILYNSADIDFDKILDFLNKALALSPKKEYEDMFVKVKNENNFIIAEKLYKEAKEYCHNKDFDKALFLIKEAAKLNPNNRMYIDFKQKIEWKQQEIKKEEKAKKHFEDGLQALQDGNFANAIKCFEEVLCLEPHNTDCKALLNKAKIGKIDITACTKQALVTLDFINEEQAENIIQARKDGMMWFEYTKFAEQFGIMPHQWADVEEKIVFPLKQANKYGRRLDI